MEDKEMLVHAIMTQLDHDYSNSEFEPFAFALINLLKLDGAEEILVDYLGDVVKEDLISGKTKLKF